MKIILEMNLTNIILLILLILCLKNIDLIKEKINLFF